MQQWTCHRAMGKICHSLIPWRYRFQFWPRP